MGQHSRTRPAADADQTRSTPGPGVYVVRSAEGSRARYGVTSPQELSTLLASRSDETRQLIKRAKGRES